MATLYDAFQAMPSRGIPSRSPYGIPVQDTQNWLNEQGEFPKGLNLGIAGAQSAGHGMVASLQDALGFEQAAAERFALAQSIQDRAAQANQLKVPEFTQIGDTGNYVGDFLNWGAGAVGSGLPSTAVGLAGAIGGRGLANVARLSPTAGTVAGAAAGMFPQEMGESSVELTRDPYAMQNTTALERLGIAAGKGGVNALLESVPSTLLVNRIANPGRIAGGFGGAVKHAAGTAAQQAGGEFLTEGAQNIVGDIAHGVANPNHQVSLHDAFNAAMAGAATGGTIGAGAAGVGVGASYLGQGYDAALDKGKEVVAPYVDPIARGVDRVKEFAQTVEKLPAHLKQVAVAATDEAMDAFDKFGPAGVVDWATRKLSDTTDDVLAATTAASEELGDDIVAGAQVLGEDISDRVAATLTATHEKLKEVSAKGKEARNERAEQAAKRAPIQRNLDAYKQAAKDGKFEPKMAADLLKVWAGMEAAGYRLRGNAQHELKVLMADEGKTDPEKHAAKVILLAKSMSSAVHTSLDPKGKQTQSVLDKVLEEETATGGVDQHSRMGNGQPLTEEQRKAMVEKSLDPTRGIPTTEDSTGGREMRQFNPTTSAERLTTLGTRADARDEQILTGSQINDTVYAAMQKAKIDSPELFNKIVREAGKVARAIVYGRVSSDKETLKALKEGYRDRLEDDLGEAPARMVWAMLGDLPHPELRPEKQVKQAKNAIHGKNKSVWGFIRSQMSSGRAEHVDDVFALVSAHDDEAYRIKRSTRTNNAGNQEEALNKIRGRLEFALRKAGVTRNIEAVIAGVRKVEGTFGAHDYTLKSAHPLDATAYDGLTQEERDLLEIQVEQTTNEKGDDNSPNPGMTTKDKSVTTADGRQIGAAPDRSPWQIAPGYENDPQSGWSNLTHKGVGGPLAEARRAVQAASAAQSIPSTAGRVRGKKTQGFGGKPSQQVGGYVDPASSNVLNEIKRQVAGMSFDSELDKQLEYRKRLKEMAEHVVERELEAAVVWREWLEGEKVDLVEQITNLNNAWAEQRALNQDALQNKDVQRSFDAQKVLEDRYKLTPDQALAVTSIFWAYKKAEFLPSMSGDIDRLFDKNKVLVARLKANGVDPAKQFENLRKAQGSLGGAAEAAFDPMDHLNGMSEAEAEEVTKVWQAFKKTLANPKATGNVTKAADKVGVSIEKLKEQGVDVQGEIKKLESAWTTAIAEAKDDFRPVKWLMAKKKLNKADAEGVAKLFSEHQSNLDTTKDDYVGFFTRFGYHFPMVRNQGGSHEELSEIDLNSAILSDKAYSERRADGHKMNLEHGYLPIQYTGTRGMQYLDLSALLRMSVARTRNRTENLDPDKTGSKNDEGGRWLDSAPYEGTLYDEKGRINQEYRHALLEGLGNLITSLSASMEDIVIHPSMMAKLWHNDTLLVRGARERSSKVKWTGGITVADIGVNIQRDGVKFFTDRAEPTKLGILRNEKPGEASARSDNLAKGIATGFLNSSGVPVALNLPALVKTMALKYKYNLNLNPSRAALIFLLRDGIYHLSKEGFITSAVPDANGKNTVQLYRKTPSGLVYSPQFASMDGKGPFVFERVTFKGNAESIEDLVLVKKLSGHEVTETKKQVKDGTERVTLNSKDLESEHLYDSGILEAGAETGIKLAALIGVYEMEMRERMAGKLVVQNPEGKARMDGNVENIADHEKRFLDLHAETKTLLDSAAIKEAESEMEFLAVMIKELKDELKAIGPTVKEREGIDPMSDKDLQHARERDYDEQVAKRKQMLESGKQRDDLTQLPWEDLIARLTNIKQAYDDYTGLGSAAEKQFVSGNGNLVTDDGRIVMMKVGYTIQSKAQSDDSMKSGDMLQVRERELHGISSKYAPVPDGTQDSAVLNRKSQELATLPIKAHAALQKAFEPKHPPVTNRVEQGEPVKKPAAEGHIPRKAGTNWRARTVGPVKPTITAKPSPAVGAVPTQPLLSPVGSADATQREAKRRFVQSTAGDRAYQDRLKAMSEEDRARDAYERAMYKRFMGAANQMGNLFDRFKGDKHSLFSSSSMDDLIAGGSMEQIEAARALFDKMWAGKSDMHIEQALFERDKDGNTVFTTGPDGLPVPVAIQGRFNGDLTNSMKRLFIELGMYGNSGDFLMTNMFHESTHMLAKMLREGGTEAKEAWDQLVKGLDNPMMRARVKKVLESSGQLTKQQIHTILSEMERSPEEATAYALSLWAMGKLTVGPKTAGVFRRIMNFFMKLMRLTTEAARTENFMKAFVSGQLARSDFKPSVIAEAFGKTASDRMMDRVREGTQPFVEIIHTVFDSSVQALDRLGVHGKKLNELYAGYGANKGFVHHVTQQMRIFGTKGAGIQHKYGKKIADIAMHHVIAQTSPEDLVNLKAKDAEKARAKASEHTKQTLAAMEEIKALITEINTYAGRANPKDVPVVWDWAKISANRKQFDDALRDYGDVSDKHKLKSKEVVDTLHELGYDYYSQREKFDFKQEYPQERAKWMQQDFQPYIHALTSRTVKQVEKGKISAEVASTLMKIEADDGADAARKAKTAIAGFEGTLGQEALNPGVRKLMHTLLTVANVVTLPLAIFTALIDPLHIMSRSGGSFSAMGEAYARGLSSIPMTIAEMFGSKTQRKDAMTQFGMDVGAIESAMFTDILGDIYSGDMMTGGLKKVNDFFFKANFLDGWTRQMRVAAVTAAHQFIIAHSKGTAVSGHKFSDHYLQELGLTPADIKIDANGMLDRNDPKIRMAINKFVDESVIRPDSTTNAIWMNDPRFMLIAHMKRFTFAFNDKILHRVVDELAHGNVAPLMPLLAAIPAILMADMMKHILKMDYSAWMNGADVGNWLGYGAERAGLPGKFQLALDAGYDVQAGGTPVDSFAGPVFGLVKKALGQERGSGQGDLGMIGLLDDAFYAYQAMALGSRYKSHAGDTLAAGDKKSVLGDEAAEKLKGTDLGAKYEKLKKTRERVPMEITPRMQDEAARKQYREDREITGESYLSAARIKKQGLRAAL